jgi:hypothetical protein
MVNIRMSLMIIVRIRIYRIKDFENVIIFLRTYEKYGIFLLN